MPVGNLPPKITRDPARTTLFLMWRDSLRRQMAGHVVVVVGVLSGRASGAAAEEWENRACAAAIREGRELFSLFHGNEERLLLMG